MKTITFMDQTYKVPDWANFITHDNDACGAVQVWEKIPQFINARWCYNTDDWLNPGENECVGHTDQRPRIEAI